MIGHKDKHGKFHPHTNNRSAIHSSDIQQRNTGIINHKFKKRDDKVFPKGFNIYGWSELGKEEQAGNSIKEKVKKMPDDEKRRELKKLQKMSIYDMNGYAMSLEAELANALNKGDGKTVYWVSAGSEPIEVSSLDEAKAIGKRELVKARNEGKGHAIEIGKSDGRYGRYKFIKWI